MGTWGLTQVGSRVSWRRGPVRALREAETGLIPSARSQQPLYTRCCFTSVFIAPKSLWWGAERSISEHNGTQGWPYITKSNSAFLVVELPVMLLPASPFTYSQPGSLQRWRNELLPKEILLPCLIAHVTCPRDDFYPVSWEDKCSWQWDRSCGHQNELCWWTLFGPCDIWGGSMWERAHCPSCAYTDSLCCEPVTALRQGFICD